MRLSPSAPGPGTAYLGWKLWQGSCKYKDDFWVSPWLWRFSSHLPEVKEVVKEEEKNHSHCLNICTRQDQPSAQLEEAHSLAATISHEWCPQLCHLAAPQLDLSLFESENGSVVSDSLQPHGLCSQWNSLGQNIGVGSLSLLQGIFPTQGLNPGVPHCRWILYQLSHQRSQEYWSG